MNDVRLQKNKHEKLKREATREMVKYLECNLREFQKELAELEEEG